MRILKHIGIFLAVIVFAGLLVAGIVALTRADRRAAVKFYTYHEEQFGEHTVCLVNGYGTVLKESCHGIGER